MTPQQRYQDALQTGFLPDPGQHAAALALQRVYDDLTATPSAPKRGLLGTFRSLVRSDERPKVRGLYLWGGVGRGKTWLMDAFHDSLPFDDKQRLHFHRFMRRIHFELKQLTRTVDPLSIVAERLADEARVLSLDEFHVSDIADAMLLGRLLDALFGKGIIVVTTSNIPPDALYKDGLQRARFLPAIELIKSNMTVLELDSVTDYRLRALERAEIYHCPLDGEAQRSLRRSFGELGPAHVREGSSLDVLGRPVEAVRVAEGMAWFEFSALCDGPRSAADYIELGRLFHTIVLANVPVLISPADDDRAQRFIQLIDELYDRNVNLIVSAAAPPADLYPSGRLHAPFERTASRLIEMQSREYLARVHLP